MPRSLALLTLGMLLGCQSLAQERPALVVNPSAATQAILQEAMSELLDGTPVRLAPDAFASTSLLSLEHAPARSIDTPAAGSRTLGKPEQFQLLVTNSRCDLLRVKTGERVRLEGLECAPGPDAGR